MGAILNNRFVKWVLAPVVVLCALVVATWVYYQYEYPTCTFRYKLTAEVQTPDGVKTGSSVVEVSYSHSGDWGGGQHANLNLLGDAVDVDLGSGKNLFLLLTNREAGPSRPRFSPSGNPSFAGGPLDAFSLPLKIFELKWIFGQEPKLCSDYAVASASAKPVIPFENLPTLVTFTDIADPSSVKVVQPENFETDFGAGYRFINAKIEPTTDVSSHNIEQVLPWWNSYKPVWIHKGFAVNYPLIDNLGYDAFRGYQKSDDGGK